MADTYTYAFLRKDLSNVQRAIQLAHATQEIGKRFPKSPISNLVLFEVADQEELVRIGGWLNDVGTLYHMFYEPDYNTGFTAIATQPLRGEERVPFQNFTLFQWEEESEETRLRRENVAA